MDGSKWAFGVMFRSGRSSGRGGAALEKLSILINSGRFLSLFVLPSFSWAQFSKESNPAGSRGFFFLLPRGPPWEMEAVSGVFPLDGSHSYFGPFFSRSLSEVSLCVIRSLLIKGLSTGDQSLFHLAVVHRSGRSGSSFLPAPLYPSVDPSLDYPGRAWPRPRTSRSFLDCSSSDIHWVGFEALLYLFTPEGKIWFVKQYL